MVNVQNTEEFACQVLNRDVWSNGAVKQIVSQHFIFWQVYHTTRDGERYTQFYPFNTFPYIAILDPRTGELLVSWSNIQDPDMMCEKITDFLHDHPSPSGGLTEEAAGTNSTSILNHTSSSSLVGNNNLDGSASGSSNSLQITDMTEDQQFAAAIAASLAAEKEHNVKEDDVDDEEIETFEPSDDEDDVVASLGVRESVQEDFTQFLGKDSVLAELMFRFPSGEREKCSFPQDSKLKAVFLWVSGKGFHLPDYELVTNFPRRNILDLPPDDTLFNVGLLKENLYIQLKS